MSNEPKLPSPEAIDLLKRLDEALWVGCGARPAKSKARDELKRRRLIESKPPNYNPIARAVAGHGRRWLPTADGREMLEFIRAAERIAAAS